jgi:hypothetical protein
MSYFSNFPRIYYPFQVNGKYTLLLVRDIALNVRIRKNILENIALFDLYDIQEGETPEIIAEKLYGDPTLHWTIMLANQRYDLYNDFPLSSEALEAMITRKYGTGKEYEPHLLFGEVHFEDNNNRVVDGPQSDLVRTISNYDYEFRVNEAKRRIKILNPNVIDRVVNEIEDAFREFVE